MKRNALMLMSWVLVAGCDNGTAVDACDIRQTACQEDIFLAVQRVRGNGWDPWLNMPEMRVITQEQFSDELEAARADNIGDDPAYSHSGAALELLHLVEPTVSGGADPGIEATVSNVAAYYDRSTRDVTIIDTGDSGDLESQTFVLAHELTHAAQDRDIGLAQWHRRRTFSESQAGSAMIEGEAVLYSSLVLADIGGHGPDELDWSNYYLDMLGRARLSVAESSSPWWQTFGLMYPLGGRYVTETWLRGGNVAVRGLFEDPPRDVVRFFDGPGGSRDRVFDPFPCGVPTPPDGYELKSSTSMGAVEFFGFATRLPLDTDAWDVARGWLGDRYVVYGDASERTIVVWQIAVAVPTDLGDAVVATFGPDSVVVDGDQVRIMLTDQPEPLDWSAWRFCTPL